MTSIAQSKLEVIDPKSGQEVFVIVHHVNGKKLVSGVDLIKYSIFGYTRKMIELQPIPRYLNTGMEAHRVQGKRVFFDINEIQTWNFSESKPKTVTSFGNIQIIKNGKRK